MGAPKASVNLPQHYKPELVHVVVDAADIMVCGEDE
jgi:hypothetical protein